MASFLEKAVRLTAKGFDIERRKLMPPGTWLALRKGGDGVRQMRYYDRGIIARTEQYRRKLWQASDNTCNDPEFTKICGSDSTPPGVFHVRWRSGTDRYGAGTSELRPRGRT